MAKRALLSSSHCARTKELRLMTGYLQAQSTNPTPRNANANYSHQSRILTFKPIPLALVHTLPLTLTGNFLPLSR